MRGRAKSACRALVGAFAAGTDRQSDDGAQPADGRHDLGHVRRRCTRRPRSTGAPRATTNTDLAEYLIPVNADIAEVEVIIVPEDDSAVNALGIKGLGELGNVGINAAVANAVFHATGIRVRELPIRLEKLLDAPAI